MIAQVAQAPIPTPLPPPIPAPPMDPNYLITEVISLVGPIGVLIVVALVVRWLFRSPVGEALAERIRAKTRQRVGEAVDDHRVRELEEQVRHLQGELAELAERVDFSERVLAEQRAQRLSAGR